jgi:thiamine biosynthesis lipoprotein
METLTDPQADPAGAGAGLAALNAAAGQGPQKIDPRLFAALERALGFCLWSERAHGPLGRDLYRRWGLRSPIEKPPLEDPESLQRAVDAAACSRLRLDAANVTATLAAGAGLDLWGFSEGLAVDRAIEILRRHGAGNAFVQLGSIYRGIGGGLDGKGWRVVLPKLPGMTVPPGRVLLLDRALAVALAAERPLRAAGNTYSPYVNQRTGRPAEGIVATLAVTGLAADAQGLAVTLTITGPAEGELRIGSIRPNPSILWFQGTGTGEPLQVEHRWGEVPKK